ncbi:hypothetical protein G6F56_002601 [Rhizopus delemar]|nr:hypothetical protein G6F56_002601 [Rhizopus delemar]
MSTIYKPTKRFIAAEDPFFQDGNILLRGFWLKKHAQTKEEIQLIMQETDTALSTQTPIDCQPCRIQLPDIVAYEKHYEAKHANVCLTCNKIFPGFEWLRLHLDEIHNTLLLIRKERGEKIHACYTSTNIQHIFHLIWSIPELSTLNN